MLFWGHTQQDSELLPGSVLRSHSCQGLGSYVGQCWCIQDRCPTHCPESSLPLEGPERAGQSLTREDQSSGVVPKAQSLSSPRLFFPCSPLSPHRFFLEACPAHQAAQLRAPHLTDRIFLPFHVRGWALSAVLGGSSTFCMLCFHFYCL